jgi:hypothetical protein
MLRAPSTVLLTSGIALGALVGSCAAPRAGEVPQVRVRWGDLDGPSAEIPDGVESLLMLVYLPGEEAPQDSAFTVEGLGDADGNGRPELVRPDLPVGEPVRIVLLGGPEDGRWTHMGSVGPIVLDYGERRFVDVRMYALGEVNSVELGIPSARFLHTATALADGRVLIAGGFERAASVACPASAPAGAVCSELTAVDDAYLFEHSSGRFYEVASPMLEARGGHTATALPDGRVLIAGGSDRAILVARPGMGANVELSLLPGSDGATSASYEVFDPNANPEEDDVDSDGDPGRGGFRGSADAPGRAGALDTGRILHAAAALDDGRVLLAGGVAAPASYTVWDPQRPGGFGVVGTGTLPASRPAPGAAVLGAGAMQRVFVAGGGDATSDAQLADVWLGAGERLGSATSASIVTPVGAPQWNLYRPIVEAFGGGQAVLVLGWYGPWCGGGTSTPTFTRDADSERCPYGMNRAFTFEVATNSAFGSQTTRPHAFGASARLDDGTVVVAGGLSELTLETSASIDYHRYTRGAAQLTESPQSLRQRRAFHAMAPLPEGGYLVFGGATFSTDGRATLTPLAAPEIMFVERARGR